MNPRAAAALLDVGKRLARLTGRQLAAVEPLLGEELADAVRHCVTIPRRAKVGSPLGLHPAGLLGLPQTCSVRSGSALPCGAPPAPC